jgi:hypothetical protein
MNKAQRIDGSKKSLSIVIACEMNPSFVVKNPRAINAIRYNIGLGLARKHPLSFKHVISSSSKVILFHDGGSNPKTKYILCIDQSERKKKIAKCIVIVLKYWARRAQVYLPDEIERGRRRGRMNERKGRSIWRIKDKGRTEEGKEEKERNEERERRRS